MANNLFYTGNGTLVDVCLDYFLEKGGEVRIGTVSELPVKKPSVQFSSNSRSIYVRGSFADVIQSINIMKCQQLTSKN